MKFLPTPLPGLLVVTAEPCADERGRLVRIFCEREFSAAGFSGRVAQANLTLTRRPGAVRGLHFQRPPRAEAKLVRCLRGEVFDVAVDLRAGSPTFLEWHAEILSGENLRALFIPEGFAHGFQALTPDCEMLYLHGEVYSPECEGGLRHDDPALAIAWPLPVSELSARDRNHPLLDPSFAGVALP